MYGGLNIIITHYRSRHFEKYRVFLRHRLLDGYLNRNIARKLCPSWSFSHMNNMVNLSPYFFSNLRTPLMGNSFCDLLAK